MDEEELKQAVEKEKRLIRSALRKGKVPPHKMKIIDGIVQNTAWMKMQLDRAREEFLAESLISAYDNGGGQKGTQKNPKFEAYKSLWNTYMTGMEKILELLKEEDQEQLAAKIEEARPKTVYERMKEKREGKA